MTHYYTPLQRLAVVMAFSFIIGAMVIAWSNDWLAIFLTATLTSLAMGTIMLGKLGLEAHRRRNSL